MPIGIRAKAKHPRPFSGNKNEFRVSFHVKKQRKSDSRLVSNPNIRRVLETAHVPDKRVGEIKFTFYERGTEVGMDYSGEFGIHSGKGVSYPLHLKALVYLKRFYPRVQFIRLEGYAQPIIELQLKRFGITSTEISNNRFPIKEFIQFLGWKVSRDTFHANSRAKRPIVRGNKEERKKYVLWRREISQSIRLRRKNSEI